MRERAALFVRVWFGFLDAFPFREVAYLHDEEALAARLAQRGEERKAEILDGGEVLGSNRPPRPFDRSSQLSELLEQVKWRDPWGPTGIEVPPGNWST